MKSWCGVVALWLGGCAAPGLQVKIESLQAQVDDLQAQVEACQQQEPKQPEVTEAAMALLREGSEAERTGDVATARAAYQRVVDEHPGGRAASVAQHQLNKLSVVGTAVTSLEVRRWLQGQGSLSDGTATLVVFWEVWCPHSRQEVPKLQATHDTFGPRGLNVVALTKITRNKTPEEVMAFVGENRLTFPVGYEDGTMSYLFAVTGVPAAAVVKDGVVIWRGHPALVTDEWVESWL